MYLNYIQVLVLFKLLLSAFISYTSINTIENKSNINIFIINKYIQGVQNP